MTDKEILREAERMVMEVALKVATSKNGHFYTPGIDHGTIYTVDDLNNVINILSHLQKNEYLIK